jgi:hypothetical protein
MASVYQGLVRQKQHAGARTKQHVGQAAATDPESMAYYLQDLASLCDLNNAGAPVANFQKSWNAAGQTPQLPVSGMYDAQTAAAVKTYWTTAPPACASFTGTVPASALGSSIQLPSWINPTLWQRTPSYIKWGAGGLLAAILLALGYHAYEQHEHAPH